MIPMNQDSARANRILGALPMNDYLRMAPHLEATALQAGQVLDAPGQPGAHIYFPVSCAATLVSVTRDGEMSELALTGREGMIGLPSLLGNAGLGMQAVVLRPGMAYRLPTPAFTATALSSAPLQALCLRYVQHLMLQMSQGVVCSLHHSVLQRLSSWLLYHRTVTEGDQVQATHETIAHMLGVRRESITQAAGLLQADHGVTTSRGRIMIDNAEVLRTHVCECYALVAEDHRMLWQEPLPPVLPAWGHGPFEHSGEIGVQEAAATLPGDGRDSRYADMYDFAPVGLLSVDSQSRLVEVNLAAAILLGISRSQCHQYHYVDFLQDEARARFEAYHREVLSGRCRRHCDVVLKAAAHRAPVIVRLEATVDESGEESRMVMIDITDTYERAPQDRAGHAPEAAGASEGLPWRPARSEGGSDATKVGPAVIG